MDEIAGAVQQAAEAVRRVLLPWEAFAETNRGGITRGGRLAASR
jgi:hypothetical protein